MYLGLVIFLALPRTRKVGYRLNWADYRPVTCAIGLAIFGPFAYIYIQTLAANGFRKAGVRKRWWGYGKKDVLNQIAALRAAIDIPPIAKVSAAQGHVSVT